MTAAVISLTVVILGVLVMHAYASYLWSKERARLVNHIVARTPSEALMLNGREKPKVPVEKRPVEFPEGLS